MFCPYCMEVIQEGAIFCKHCHRNLRRRRWPIFLAIVGMLIVAAAVFVWLWMRQPATPPSKPSRLEEQGAGTAMVAGRSPKSSLARETTTAGPAQPDIDAARMAMLRIVTDGLSGSGFLISEDGLAITCKHVLAGPGITKVYFQDGTSSRLCTVQMAPEGDLALLRLAEVRRYPHLDFGDATQLKAGQEATVLGYPMGLDTLVLTRGVVSAAPIYIPIADIPLIQIDASINPGNSGGPLLDQSGKVVGVVVAKLRGAEAMNWVVPINFASQFGVFRAAGLNSRSFMEWRLEAKARMARASKAPGDSAQGKDEGTHGGSVKIFSVSRASDKLIVNLALLDETGNTVAGTTTFTVEATWPPRGHCISIEQATTIMQVGNGSHEEGYASIEIGCSNLPASGAITICASARGANQKARYVYTAR